MHNRILVAVDMLEPVVFETALSIAALTDADLLLLHVLYGRDIDSPDSPLAIIWDCQIALDQYSWQNYQAQWSTYSRKSLEVLRDCTEQAEAAGVNADFLQTTNSPGKDICKTAKTWQADLIVMGSHHRRGVEELMLGSVSNYVTHHAPCSVMIIALENDLLEDEFSVPDEVYQAA